MAKNFLCVIYFVIFCICNTNCLSQVSISDLYRSQIGIRESPPNSNWGPDVKKYLKSVKVFAPAPWCSAFVKWNLDSAKIPNTLTAWSPTAHNSKNIVLFKGRFYKKPQPGDVFTLYFPRLKRIAHTGFYDYTVNATVYSTVEGNTNEQGSREGDGVMRRYRSFNATYSISRWQ